MPSNSQKPLVTVGIPLYNHEKYIRQCLTSIINQTYDNIEIIIIDDGSNDNSYNIATKLLKEKSSNKKYYIKTRKNKGMCNTLNEIAKKARGKYISFIGSDDFWCLNKIEDQVKYLENNPTVVLVHSNSKKIDENNNEVGVIDMSKKENSGNLFKSIIYSKGGINTPSHLYRTNIYKKIGYYDPSFKFEDTDFWLRLTKNHQVGYINYYHTYYRWHSENLSNSNNMLKFYYEELIKIYNKNIDDEKLKKYVICKILKKGYTRSLRKLHPIYFFNYLFRYIKCKYLDDIK